MQYKNANTDSSLLLGNASQNTKGATPYEFKGGDIVLSIAMLAFGFFFWEWNVTDVWYVSLPIFVLIVAGIVISLVYLKYNKANFSKRGLVFGLFAMLSSIPFIIYDNTPLAPLQLIFALALVVLMIMYFAKTEITIKLNGFILGDLINQFICVPFLNFPAMFKSLFYKYKDDSRIKAGLYILIGILLSTPLFFIILNLLISADVGFAELAMKLNEYLNLDYIVNYAFSFILGIPIACYLTGLLYGNARKRKSDTIRYESLNSLFENMHKLARPIFYGSLLILNLIYIIFLIVMSSYHFSGFFGDIPNGLTPAEYARSGFFELCGVSAINLLVILFVYIFAKRGPKEYPKLIKAFTAILSLLTLLLVVISISKMYLYINTFGLTQLRVYTMWFMLIILIVFTLIVVWHFKSFNIARPIIYGIIVMFLVLSLCNSDGLIAKYNIEQFESGKTEELDLTMFDELSDAAVIEAAITYNETDNEDLKRNHLLPYFKSIEKNRWDTSFIEWNMQSAKAEKLIEQILD